MKFNIQSPHIQKLNPETQIVIQEKFERFERQYDRIERCNILLKKEKNAKRNNFLVEATLVIPGNDLFAKELAESFEIAAEEVCRSLESQLKKHKTKLHNQATVSADQQLEDDDIE
jgi:putative sigma-54 modulation protein